MRAKVIAISLILGVSFSIHAFELTSLQEQQDGTVLNSTALTFENVSKVKFDTLSIDSEETFEKMSQ